MVAVASGDGFQYRGKEEERGRRIWNGLVKREEEEEGRKGLGLRKKRGTCLRIAISQIGGQKKSLVYYGGGRGGAGGGLKTKKKIFFSFLYRNIEVCLIPRGVAATVNY